MYLVYGKNCCIAILNNPRRRIAQAWISEDFLRKHGKELTDDVHQRLELLLQKCRFTPSREVEKVSQGIALYVAHLKQPSLEEVISQNIALQDSVQHKNACSSVGSNIILIALDNLSDPQNIGAIIRSASAFGITAVLHPQHRTPDESLGILKASAGCFENIPYVSVTNLRNALDFLDSQDFYIIGLAADGEKDIFESLTDAFGKKAINQSRDQSILLCVVLGCESAGIRQHVLKKCREIARIDISAKVESLNVSNAAAIMMHAIWRFVDCKS